MEINAIVIDNFLDDPDQTRNAALSLDFDKVSPKVPGLRTIKYFGDRDEIESKMKNIFSCNQINWDFDEDSFSFQSCVEGTDTWHHVDPVCPWAGVLYLHPDPLIMSGTGIFHREDDSEDVVLNIGMGNLYNRLVLYRGNVLLHRSMVPGFGNTIETSRLTQTFFFNIK